MPNDMTQQPDGDFSISADSFRQKMQVPTKLQKSYNIAVGAGLKLMFDPKTRDQTMEYMKEASSDPEKIGTAVAGIMATIVQKSNGTIPGQIIIPAGVELIGHAVDMAKSIGIDVDNNVVADSVAKFIQIVLQQSGASTEQIQQIMGGMDSGQPTPGVSPTQPVSQTQPPQPGA